MPNTISTDFLLDSATGDLMVRNGDLVVGESDGQHLDLMIIGPRGSWKDDIMKGVGIGKYVNAQNVAKNRDKVNGEIRLQLELDGWNLETINTDNLKNITINAEKINQ